MTKTAEQITRAYAVLDHIETNPDKHDQSRFAYPHYEILSADMIMTMCVSHACFAGWTVLLDGQKVEDGFYLAGTAHGVADEAADLLGLHDHEKQALFYDARDLDAVRKAVFEIFGPRPDGAL